MSARRPMNAPHGTPFQLPGEFGFGIVPQMHRPAKVEPKPELKRPKPRKGTR